MTTPITKVLQDRISKHHLEIFKAAIKNPALTISKLSDNSQPFIQDHINPEHKPCEHYREA